MPNHLETREAAYAEAIRNGRLKMLLVLAVCAAPVIASYVSFYFLKPEGRTNYGAIVEVKPLFASVLTLLDGKPFELREFKGKWVLVMQDSGDCPEACIKKLYAMRQVRLMQGKDRDRIERAWFITDDAALSTMTMREYDGTRMLRARGAALLKEFPAPQRAEDHVYLIDPLGNLVLRFPKDADPARMKKDLDRLLKYSRIG